MNQSSMYIYCIYTVYSTYADTLKVSYRYKCLLAVGPICVHI